MGESMAVARSVKARACAGAARDAMISIYWRIGQAGDMAKEGKYRALKSWAKRIGDSVSLELFFILEMGSIVMEVLGDVRISCLSARALAAKMDAFEERPMMRPWTRMPPLRFPIQLDQLLYVEAGREKLLRAIPLLQSMDGLVFASSVLFNAANEAADYLCKAEDADLFSRVDRRSSALLLGDKATMEALACIAKATLLVGQAWDRMAEGWREAYSAEPLPRKFVGIAWRARWSLDAFECQRGKFEERRSQAVKGADERYAEAMAESVGKAPASFVQEVMGAPAYWRGSSVPAAIFFAHVERGWVAQAAQEPVGEAGARKRHRL